ncbi:MAG: methylenetetrahydrofolate reductase [archaeon]
MNKSFAEVLKEKKFTKSIELVPLRNGRDYSELYRKIGGLKGEGIDFISVTKGAGGSLRGGTLPLTFYVKERIGVNAIAHFTCRENSVQEIENSLIDHHLFGIRNILALRGDPPTGVKEEKKGPYDCAWQLVRQIREMNEGHYLVRKGEKEFREGEKTDFCVGVAAHPEENLDEEISFLKKKEEEGAEFAITQMFFSAGDYVNYRDKASEEGIEIPIIPGVKPLTKYRQAEFVENSFKVKVPKELKEMLKDSDEEKARENGIEFTAELCRELKKEKAPGIHLFILQDVDLAREVIKRI